MDAFKIFVGIFLTNFHLALSSAETETCTGINVYSHNNDYYYNWHVWNNGDYWHNMTFWGGHVQIPSKGNMEIGCHTEWGKFVVLKEKHPDISTIDEDIITLQACALNENDICEGNLDVELRKCHGDLLYRFPWYDLNDPDIWDYDIDIWDYLICFDRIYTNSNCDETVYQIENNNDRTITLESGSDIKVGWMNAFINGKQFLPIFQDEEDTVLSECMQQGYGLVLKDPVPDIHSETPVRLPMCWRYNHEYYYDYDGIDSDICYENGYIFTRMCNGRLQFDLSRFSNWHGDHICFVHHNNIKVEPEIGHKIGYNQVKGNIQTVNSPFLQYRCTFDMVNGVSYKTNWYINGTFQVQMGPSSNQDELVFKEDFLSDLVPGYEVQCGVLREDGSNSTEALSDAFLAGWKVKDDSILLSKSGSSIVEIEQTIPVGCYYSDDEDPMCEESITFEDESSVSDVCAGGIRVQDTANVENSFIKIKTLRKEDQWTSMIHRVMLTTVDSTYDDNTEFDLQVYVPHINVQDNPTLVTKEKLGAVHKPDTVTRWLSCTSKQVRVTDNYRHRNKRCYSHVDPHMRTADGLHYEAQKEGDYILYRNKKYQTEVQQSARYCSPGYENGPVCACGIAIAVGADTFIFNRCFNTTFKFDLQCKDGGLIDIVEVHSHHYLVRTPIGTIISITFGWGDTMDIDIYVSAKDFGNVDGLCGTFDGNRSNDLLHRDNTTISYDNNRSYRFADSWRLADEENLFKNDQRLLQSWNTGTNGIADQPCNRPNSVSKRKCKINRRTRRATKGTLHHKELNMPGASSFRRRRSTDSFTEEEAFALCNNSIYATPAVVDFPEYLAEEDPNIVVEQCVYDLTNDNSTIWIEAHVTSLNNVADTILSLNPVFVANNTDMVNTFRSQICLNNCSGNGECLETGVCECHGTFRGPDCTDDIRIPPVVYSIEGDGICEITEDDDCTCFEIRSDNIFDGFMCNISKHMLYFNGTRDKLQQSTHAGYYEDIFTGECCAPEDRKRRSSDTNDDEPHVISYELSVSNDGATYGETNSVFIYDTQCLKHNIDHMGVTIEIKVGYCFIDGVCVAEHKFLSTKDCLLCNPAANLYKWTKGTCENADTHLKTEIIIGLVIGCTLVVVVASLLLGYYLCCKKSRTNRKIHDSNACLQTEVTSIRLPDSGKSSFMYYKHKL